MVWLEQTNMKSWVQVHGGLQFQFIGYCSYSVDYLKGPYPSWLELLRRMAFKLYIFCAEQHLISLLECNMPPMPVSCGFLALLCPCQGGADGLPALLQLFLIILRGRYLRRSYRNIEGQQGLTPIYYLVG